MIVKNFKWFLMLPIAAVVAALIVGFACGGFNLGLDFTGGTVINIEMGTEDFSDQTVADAVRSVESVQGEVSVTKSENVAIVRIQDIGDEAATGDLVGSIVDKVAETYSGAEQKSIDSVGGTASGELIKNAALSIAIAGILMLLYIWIRFDLYSGIGALAALLINILVMVCVMCIFRVQLDSTFIAACLTILGYSINDTVVLFDRIRENMGKFDKNTDSDALVMTSVKQTLGRTINTSATTLIMVACVFILGVDSIRIFTFPLLIGIVVGTYSSIFIAAPIWIKLEKKFGKGKKKSRVKVIS